MGSKVFSDLSGLVQKLAGPVADEFGQMLGEKAREYRMRNALRIFQRVQKMLLNAGIDPQTIAPRIFLPMLEAASIEDNDTLQERWAALLANASNPQCGAPVLASFVEVLKQLTSEQALFLDKVFSHVTQDGKLHITEEGVKIGTFNTVLQLFAGDRSQQKTFTDQGLRERVLLATDDLARLGILSRALLSESTLDQIQSKAGRIKNLIELDQVFDIETDFFLTRFGLSFIQACTAPEPQ
jgi:hypothetical protein